MRTNMPIMENVVQDLAIRSRRDPEYGWHRPVLSFFTPLEAVPWDAEGCDYKLNGVDYTDKFAEFKQEIEKIIVWEKISAS